MFHYSVEDLNNFPKLSPFASWPNALINHQWLELPMSQTSFHGPLDDWAIKVQLSKVQINKDKSSVLPFLFLTQLQIRGIIQIIFFSMKTYAVGTYNTSVKHF